MINLKALPSELYSVQLETLHVESTVQILTTNLNVFTFYKTNFVFCAEAISTEIFSCG